MWLSCLVYDTKYPFFRRHNIKQVAALQSLDPLNRFKKVVQPFLHATVMHKFSLTLL